jgi:hypothetical protein
MPDPNKPQATVVPARPAPPLDKVRHLLGRYRQTETSRSRDARTAMLAPPARKRGD